MMAFVTQSSLYRLAGLLVFLLLLGGVGWWGMIRMPGESYTGEWTGLEEEERELRGRLRRDVEELAGEIGDRNVFAYENLQRAEAFLEGAFREAGHEPRRMPYRVRGKEVVNLEVEIRGRGRPEEIVVVGAHYDSVPGSPAANDNGSGVAALLALARAFEGMSPERTLRLVAFVNEEPPFFQTEDMGSLVYARASRERGEKIVAMISLETLGYYTDEPGSQRYPFPLNFFYPDRGNFVAFVGNVGSRELVRKTLGSFREAVDFPSEGAALPEIIPQVGWSDHWSFWEMGYPALMVTDTALFRYPHYHQSEDTPEKLDVERMTRVVRGVETVVRQLLE